MPTSSHLEDRAKILVVDDAPTNLMALSTLLMPQYCVRVANSGERALEIARDWLPDLILLDVVMPRMDGFEVCRQLKASPITQHIPIIFLTGMSGAEDEEAGLNLGAADYITKPFSAPIALARVRTQLALKSAADFLKDQNQFLEAEVRRRMLQVSVIQDVAMMAMASLAETRDNETGNHIRRTQHYVRALAIQMRRLPKYVDILTDDYIETLYKSAPLHDIGKVGVPDRILLKPGKLDASEFEIMRTHTTLGRNAICSAEALLGSDNSFLRCAREIAYSHQEKWDGSGYPEGLAGEAIPLSARLMAVADVYDALISRRVYKPPYSHAQAATFIVASSGSHFDPDVVEAFRCIADRMHSIAKRFVDHDDDINVIQEVQ